MYGIIHHSNLRPLKNPPTKINWPLFSGVILILFASFINSSALFISMVDIKINLQLNFVEMTWISIVYLTFVTGFIGVAGQYGDMYGHIKLFMVGSLIYLICCIILSACTNVAMLMVGRAIQGLGVAFLVANSLSIIRMCAPSNQVARLMKIWVITLFSAYSLGCILGALMSSVNWRLNYWIMFAFVIPGLYLVWKNRLAANDEFEKKPIDYLGTLLILLSVILLVLLFTTPAIWSWHSPAVITFIVVTPLLFIAFLVREKIAHYPLVPLSIFKNMDFSLGVIQIFSCFFGFFVFLFFNILYLHTPAGLHHGIITTAAFLVPPLVLIVIGAIISPTVVKHLGLDRTLLIGWLFFLAGALTLAFSATNISYLNLWWRFCLVGVGLALVYPNVLPFTMLALPKNEAGEASGILLTVQLLGATLGIAIGQSWYLGSFSHSMQKTFTTLSISTEQQKELISQAHSSTKELQKSLANFDHSQAKALLQNLNQAAANSYHDINWLIVIISSVGLVSIAAYCLLQYYRKR